jgi:hypothetical protein
MMPFEQDVNTVEMDEAEEVTTKLCVRTRPKG